MPRYFFHLTDGSRERDREGTELVSNAVARVEAIKLTGAVMSEDPDRLWDGREFRVEVTDERARLLFTVITSAQDAPAARES